jgi:hypothetical protein
MREREARLWFAVIAVSGMLVAGCTSPDEPAAEETSPSGAANSQDRGEALRPQDQLRRLEPAPAANVVGLIDEQGGVTRAGNEHTLVVWHPPNDFDHVFYRIYDRAWAPVTDLFEVRVGLEVVRGLRSSFLCPRDSVQQELFTELVERVGGHRVRRWTPTHSPAGRTIRPGARRSPSADVVCPWVGAPSSHGQGR